MQSVSGPPKTLEPVPEEPSSSQALPPIKTTFVRPPSSKGTLRSAQGRRPSFPSSTNADAQSPAAEATSWRSKTLPTRSTPQQPPQVTSPPDISIAPPLTVTLPEVDHLVITADEEVEVIDFSEHGKLVGVDPEPPQPERPTPEPTSTSVVERRRPRPLAIDFFDDTNALAQSAKSDEGVWRRKPEGEPDYLEKGEVEVIIRERTMHPPVSAPIHSTSISRRRLSVSSDDHSRHYNGPSHSANTPRSPQASHYREAPMSALDDTMARIKGALDGMLKPEQPKPQTKWLPPALRPRTSLTHLEDSPTHEVFDMTACEPPRSPKPAWNHFTVKLPSVSCTSVPLSRKQLHSAQTQPHVRADIYSWDPPIEGMNRKDFHLNDILFKRPPSNKAPIKYTVILPGKLPDGAIPSKPVVHLPQKSGSPTNNATGAFGRRREADGVANWRKPPPSPLKTHVPEESEIPEVLDTVSRSPPPEAPTSAGTPPITTSDAQSPAVSVAPTKGRLPSKMPVGSDVAFYRDARSEQSSMEPKSTVNFTVHSELEEHAPQESASLVSSVSNGVVVSEPTILAQANVHTLISKVETHRVEAQVNSKRQVSMVAYFYEPLQPSVAAVPETPPHVTISAPWPKSPRALSLKESPARPPDPEHLKAVWSQTSNKAEPPSINSLEGIGDDLAPVPFTISEVKSEDGETPPPTQPSGPSRMSLHDVTRAFQQVPTSSSANKRTAPFTSPPTTHRQPTIPHPPPNAIPNGAVRPPYAGYPPVVSSPSPTMVYSMPMAPSPIPRQMIANGAPQYPHGMWVPVAGAPPTNGMMRPVASAYGPQFMGYPPTGPIPMYMTPPPPNMQSLPPQMNGAQNRPPNMPMMSPMLSQAQAGVPMYAGSPVLVQTAPVMRVPSGTSYSSSGQAPSRGQVRSIYDQAPGMMPHSPAIHPQNAYTTIPSNPLDRTTW